MNMGTVKLPVTTPLPLLKPFSYLLLESTLLKGHQTERNDTWSDTEGISSMLYVSVRPAQNLHVHTAKIVPGDNDLKLWCTEYSQHLPDVRYNSEQHDSWYGGEIWGHTRSDHANSPKKQNKHDCVMETQKHGKHK